MPTTSATEPPPSPTALGRMQGAMFLTLFGAGWLTLWSMKAFGPHLVSLAPVWLGVLAMLAFCVMQYRKLRGRGGAEQPSPMRQRIKRQFRIINVVQWVCIFLAIKLLTRSGLSAWIVPAVMLIVGLHFFPIAHLFHYPPYHVTALALVVLALAYPFLSARGPLEPWGCFGAGLILVLSAIWNLRQTVPGAAAACLQPGQAA